MITRGGEMMVVAHGRQEKILVRIIEGEEVGTLFLPRRQDRTSSRARWIGAARPSGRIVVDEGASRAIIERNVSLLPAGVARIEGAFEKGDVVSIETESGRKIAHGLTNNAAEDLVQAGIRGILNFAPVTLQVPAAVCVSSVDIGVHLEPLSFQLNGGAA